MPGWRVDVAIRADHTAHVWPADDQLGHDLGSGPCICGPRLEESATGNVLVIHHSIDGRERAEI